MTYMSAIATRTFAQKVRSFSAYGLLLVGVVVVYLLIRAYGDTLSAPAPINPGGGEISSQVHVNDFLHVLLAMLLVISAARALGALFRLIQQPPVVGEMIAGILLGPSLLGHFAPGFFAFILPHSVAPLLNVISQVGVILYMFLVGLELDFTRLRNRAHSTVIISHTSIVAPFLLGAALALVLYPRLSTTNVSFTAFSLFLGVSMSVTAFPVLARILTDQGIQKTKMGTLTLACAAIDDVSAWCLLAFVVSVTNTRAGSALPTLLLALGYIVFMFLVVRPVVVRSTRLADTKGRVTQGVLAFVLLAILLSSLATESIGIHSIFGAFVLGAIIPHESFLARELMSKLEDFVIVFLLPAFFTFTGLRTQIGLVSGAEQWFFCGLIILVASLGKFGGSAIAGKISGLAWRDASAVGVLMNTRGLMELIVLNIGLELHVISPTLFAMLVLMALVTTLATTPILQFIAPRHRLQQEADAIEAASKLAAATKERSGTLVAVMNPDSATSLLDVASSLSSAEDPPPRVMAVTRGGVTTLRSSWRETEELQPSRSPLLAAALDAAWSRGTPIIPQAIWALDPAREIVDAAEQAEVRWLVIESRRSMLGRFPTRGVAARILERAGSLPINVAVLLRSSVQIQIPVICLVNGGPDNASSLELATRLAASRGETPRVSEISDSSSLKDVPNGLVILGKHLIEKWHVDFDEFTKNRSVIIAQGAGKGLAAPVLPSTRYQTVSV
jgi:Kef-type K+ transport system membrane component KefB